jgi:hypothetical protein
VGGVLFLMAAATCRVNDPHSSEIFAHHFKGLKMKEIPRLRSSTRVKSSGHFANFAFGGFDENDEFERKKQKLSSSKRERSRRRLLNSEDDDDDGGGGGSRGGLKEVMQNMCVSC